MKAVNFWKTLFCAALAVTAFTACSDDDDNGYSGTPEISVNGAATVSVVRDLTAGETSPVVSVVIERRLDSGIQQCRRLAVGYSQHDVG